MNRILLVDDDSELCDLLVEYLGAEGFEIEAVGDGQLGFDRAKSGNHDLVILDVMLPTLTGLEVLRLLRETLGVPVLMLTARGEEIDRIIGLELGADDYLSKPFNPRELAARIRAILRRAEGSAGAPEYIIVNDTRIDIGARRVTVADQEISLTGVEFTVLETLARSAGHVVSRDDLSQVALHRRTGTCDRSLDVHISNLRRKLGSTGKGGRRIKTVRGVGYQFLRAGERGARRTG